MPKVLIAVEGCTFTDTVHGGQCVIKSGLSPYSTVNGSKVCLDGLVVTVAGGTVPGTQIDPVDVTLNAQIIQGSKIDGKLPLALNEISSGQETGKYQVGDDVVTAPIIIQITDAGQLYTKAQ